MTHQMISKSDRLVFLNNSKSNIKTIQLDLIYACSSAKAILRVQKGIQTGFVFLSGNCSSTAMIKFVH